MNYSYVLGIDPGKTGAIAAIDEGHNVVSTLRFDKLSDFDIWEYVLSLTMDRPKAFLEKVHSMPMQGIASTFSFGERYGTIKMALIAAGIPFELVPPQTWQTKLGIKRGGMSYIERKRRNKALAEQYFPHRKITQDIADAFLLGEYGHRTEYRVR